MESDQAVQQVLEKELAETRVLSDVHRKALETREQYLASPDALANDRTPAGVGSQLSTSRLLLSERLEHREIVLLRMAGLTTREIADQTGFAYSTVHSVLRQPWARQRVIEHLQKNTQNLCTMIEKEAAASLLTLVELRDDPNTPPSVRSSNSNSILDRYLGKAPQTVNINKANVPTTAEDAERQLAALRAEEARLRGN